MKTLAIFATSGMRLVAALSLVCIAGIGASALTQRRSSHAKGVNLGSAANYVILTKTGITTTGTTEVSGNMGVSPINSTAITGFGLVVSANGQYSTSALVNGQIYASDYADPTPANLNSAIGDMQHAYSDAAGRTSPAPISLPTELGGLTLGPGIYKTASAVGISGDVTLNGTSKDVWIFQISQDLTQAAGTRVVLTGGAIASNVFWQVAGVVAIGSTAQMQGEVLAKTGITLNAGATVRGRLLAQTNVTMISNQVVRQ